MLNDSDEDYPNCVKEREHGDEWNTIAQFFEWLIQTKQAYLVKPSKYINPITIAGTLTQLLKLWHEYIGVDETELEKERRRLIEDLQKKA